MLLSSIITILPLVALDPPVHKKSVHRSDTHFVELEGVEPSSKRGNNTLSTRLVIGKIFEYTQDRDNQHIPYPLKCRHCIKACNG